MACTYIEQFNKINNTRVQPQCNRFDYYNSFKPIVLLKLNKKTNPFHINHRSRSLKTHKQIYRVFTFKTKSAFYFFIARCSTFLHRNQYILD